MRRTKAPRNVRTETRRPADRRKPEGGKPRLPASEEPSRRSVVFGVLPVEELLKSGSRRVEKVYVAEGGGEHRLSGIFELARTAGVRFERVTREEVARASGSGANHQGVVAFVSAAEYADADKVMSKIEGAGMPLVLILDGVEDPRNLGALLRVAECAGVDAVFLPEHRAVGLTETVVKTAAGAVEYVDVAKVRNLNRLIEELKEMNVWVVGTSGEAEMSHTDWDWNRPSAVVMGGEGSGLHRLVAENCDALVKIPMMGRISSLNVSVAAGVVLFEALRQRGAKVDSEED
jgi:23S rRNA (guanosine2251-2'-O)-methyltransferase